MCQVNGCGRFGLPDPQRRVTIPGHVDADVELCVEHDAHYQAEGYLSGLMVSDKPWPEYVAEFHGIARV